MAADVYVGCEAVTGPLELVEHLAEMEVATQRRRLVAVEQYAEQSVRGARVGHDLLFVCLFVVCHIKLLFTSHVDRSDESSRVGFLLLDGRKRCC